MADPALSLQCIFITATAMGKHRARVYAAWVALFSTLAGLLHGAWNDGVSVWLIAACLLGAIALLSAALVLISRRTRRAAIVLHVAGQQASRCANAREGDLFIVI